MELARAAVRAEWVARQGLGTCVSAVDAARRCWAYQTGGTGAYLALRARAPDLSREDIDGAVADGTLVILTGIRGCTFLVPADDDPLARAAWRARVEASVDQLAAFGLDLPKLVALCDQIEAFASEPCTPQALRKQASSIQDIDAPRFGLTNTLPLAVRMLEAEGRLTRLPARGRLDDEHYVWRRTRRPRQPADPERQLVRRYVGWTGPAARSHVAAWLDVNGATAEERLQASGARETEDGWRLDEVHGADDDRVHFLPLRDPLVDLRTSALVPDASQDVVVDGWGRNPTAVGQQPTVHHHTIVWRNAIVGL